MTTRIIPVTCLRLFCAFRKKKKHFRFIHHRFTTLAPAHFQPILARTLLWLSNQIEAAVDSDFSGTLN